MTGTNVHAVGELRNYSEREFDDFFFCSLCFNSLDY